MAGIPWLGNIPAPPTTHDALADDLAAYLRAHRRPHMTWRNVTFAGSDCFDFDGLVAYAKRYDELCRWPARRYVPLLHPRIRDCRPDVLAIRASLNGSGIHPTAYEVKITRADFLADVRAEKWRVYQRIASSVYFATPDELIHPKEIPDGAGLIVRKPGHWRRVKLARRCDWQPSDRYWLTLLVRGRDRLFWDRIAEPGQ